MQDKNNLNGALERYSVTARGQQGRRFGDYAGFAAAVGAGMAMAGGAEATVIYSGVQNLSIALDPNVAVPFQTTFGAANYNVLPNLALNGGSGDINLQLVNIGARNNSNVDFKYVGAGLLQGQNGAKFVGQPGYLGVGGSNLAMGALIGPSQAFSTSAVGRIRLKGKNLNSTNTGIITFDAGNFAPGVTGIAGIQLGNGDYGWIRLRIDSDGVQQPLSVLTGDPALQDGLGFPDRLTVIDWAVEDSGAPIQAGAIPEPSTLALLAAGAAGLARLRRRQMQAH